MADDYRLRHTVCVAPRVVACVLASLLQSATLNATAPTPLRARNCVSESESIARAWRATGEWRSLAPYPMPRDASPTDSVGVWIERAVLSDGSEEMRRVSAAQTTVVRIDPLHCRRTETAHFRTYDSAASIDALTDDRLRTLLAAHARGVVYVWSPRMPWSVRGLAEAQSAANSLGIAFTAVVADADLDEVRAADVDPIHGHRLDALDLVYRNATQHYPSVLFYRDGALLDVAIPGYKNRDTYREIGAQLFSSSRTRRVALPVTASAAALLAAPVATSVLTSPPKFWVDHSARVTTRATVTTIRRLGFFFKPIPNSNLVSYTANEASYLFDMRTGKEQRIPGNVDPVPTPDGRLLMRPGLKLYPMRTLTKGDTIPVFFDPQLPDEYQTASILHEAKGVVRYRVITGWRQNARFRDYDVTFTTTGAYKSTSPVGAPFVPCGTRRLSLPINAKSGGEFGAYDEGTHTSVILEVTPMQSCLDKLDLGFASGKMSFSYDGRLVAFATSRVDTDAEGTRLRPSDLVYKDALVLYRATGRIVALSHNKGINALSFPEFQTDGSVMVLDQAGPGRSTEVLRTVVVR